jgi:hypothetical protein
MRALFVVALVLSAGIAHAAPCISVTSPEPDDASIVRRALASELPQLARTCLDVSIVTRPLAESADEILLVASVQVMISDDRGHMRAVVTGGATLHVARGNYRPRRAALYRRDLLEQAITSVLPALRTRLLPPSRPAA